MNCIHCPNSLVEYPESQGQSLYCGSCNLIFNTKFIKQFYSGHKDKMMILDQLARICHEIRVIEREFRLPPNCVDEELTASAIDHKKRREENLAITLYNTLKKYALGDNNDHF